MINFIRFRESQTEFIDEHFNKSQRTKIRVEQLYDEKEPKETQLADLERNRNATTRLLQETEKRYKELHQRLRELLAEQERLQEKATKAKEQQHKLKELVIKKHEEKQNVEDEVSKLRTYTEQSPTALEDALRDLNDRLVNDKAQIESFDRRARMLQTSTESFGVVTADMGACTRLLTDVLADLAKEEEELAKASRHQDALTDKSNIIRDIERQERLLQKQRSNLNARMDKVKKKADDEAAAASRKMEEMREAHARLTKERGEKSRDMEERRVKIEQTEKKVGFVAFFQPPIERD